MLAAVLWIGWGLTLESAYGGRRFCLMSLRSPARRIISAASGGGLIAIIIIVKNLEYFFLYSVFPAAFPFFLVLLLLLAIELIFFGLTENRKPPGHTPPAEIDLKP